jgi:hypothetical protein
LEEEGYAAGAGAKVEYAYFGREALRISEETDQMCD